MLRLLKTPSRSVLGLFGLTGATLLILLGAGQAKAADAVYPAGAGTFSGGAQGWQVTDASCNVPVLCSASGGYDGTDGQPPGSVAANTSILLNLVGLFKSTVTLQSPDFTVADGGAATLHLDRQFAPASLVDLAPQSTYTVTLLDRTAERQSVPLTETIAAASGFTGKDATVSVAAGHTYAISITTETSSSVAGTGLLAGATSTRFDNVSLSSGGSGGGGGNNGGNGNNGGAGGAGGLSDRLLLSTIQGNLAPATVKGQSLFVKAKCPAKIGHACRVTLQGLLKKRSAATATRVVKIPKGKTKQIVLTVKSKARGKVGTRKKLLFKETVKAGGAKATLYKHLKLIRH
jgi:hypothetical protein